MFITVKLYGTLRRLSNNGTPGLWQGDVPDGITVNEVVLFLGTRIEEVAAAMRNGEPCGLSDKIEEGDILVLVTPFGGG